jgi:hypothetical protein
MRLKVTKSVCDEFLSNRLLKEFADIFAGPVCSLINLSIRQGLVPRQWKVARISPLPKVYPPISIETDFRPISITSSVAKVAESFVCRFLIIILIRVLIQISMVARLIDQLHTL